MRLQQHLRALAIFAIAAAAIVIPSAAAPATEQAVSLECFPHAPSTELRYDDTWGAGRSGGRSHKGTDIMSPKGLEVKAVADGVVTTLGDGSTSGYYVRLVHEGGWESWYMHLNNDDPDTDNGRGGAAAAYAPGIAEGLVVRAGDVIGYVGDSGNAEWAGSHTHFELHIDGTAVNPYPYLVDAQLREAALLDVVADLAFTAVSEVEQIRQGWRRNPVLTETGIACLPETHKDILTQFLGTLPGRATELPLVEAR